MADQDRRRSQAQQLQENELLGELLGAWRQEVIDAMLFEGDPAKREQLWQEQLYLHHLTERLSSELTGILSGRESES